MPDERLRLLILGAHPDDAEYHSAGLASVYRKLGHIVKMVSVTDGSAGHHEKSAGELAAIRREEATASGAVIGAEYDVWEFTDGELVPTLEVRRKVIREIRTFAPDLVVTHRANDYHPDHRAVGQVVQDASFMVTVPRVVPDVPTLKKDPVVAYMPDLFTKPCPLAADVVIDVTGEVDTIVSMLACHRSQVFEWLPYLQGTTGEVPEDEEERLRWLRAWYARAARPRADRFRKELIAAYGEERGGGIEYAEIYEVSEYAAGLDDSARRRLFPFAGK